MNSEAYQLTLYDLGIWSGKTSPELSPPRKAKISGRSSKKLSELRTVPLMCLDLTPGHGNLLGQSYWEINSAWLGECWTLNTGPAPPSEENVYTLSQILEDHVPQRYYLSRTACLGILRRAEARGKELPPQLREALLIQAGLA